MLRLPSRWQRKARELDAIYGLVRKISEQSVAKYLAELDDVLELTKPIGSAELIELQSLPRQPTELVMGELIVGSETEVSLPEVEAGPGDDSSNAMQYSTLGCDNDVQATADEPHESGKNIDQVMLSGDQAESCLSTAADTEDAADLDNDSKELHKLLLSRLEEVWFEYGDKDQCLRAAMGSLVARGVDRPLSQFREDVVDFWFAHGDRTGGTFRRRMGGIIQLAGGTNAKWPGKAIQQPPAKAKH